MPTLDQLDEQLEAIRAKLQLQIVELVDVITGDLPTFTLKQIRRAFIEDVEFAEKLSDAELTAFKSRVHAFGDALAVEIRASLLDDMDAWWGKAVPLDAGGKTLDGNPAIAAKLAVIAPKIEAFIDHEHLSPIEISYKTPAYFIQGKYAPGMIEKYWSQLANLRAAEESRAIVDREERKARLAQRWDEP